MAKLDKYEKEVLNHFEKGHWQPFPDNESRIQRYRSMASRAVKKEERVNLRLTARDVQSIKMIAHEEGLPYQTFIASILHKFVTGRLTEKRA